MPGYGDGLQKWHEGALWRDMSYIVTGVVVTWVYTFIGLSNCTFYMDAIICNKGDTKSYKEATQEGRT